MNDPRDVPPSRKVLDAMLVARRQMSRCIDRFDTLLYNPHDRGFTEQGLDRLVLETISTLRQVSALRHGQNSGVP
jgi:hypothetical protein